MSEQTAFESMLRRTWRPDFEFKDFSSLTHQPPQSQVYLSNTWPVLFMYPVLTQAHAIYGVKLETVGYLSYALARTHNNLKPVVSPVFSMYEGESAYILMQPVSRAEQARDNSKPDFFGSPMVALLLIKTGWLLEAVNHANETPWLVSVPSSTLLPVPTAMCFQRRLSRRASWTACSYRV